MLIDAYDFRWYDEFTDCCLRSDVMPNSCPQAEYVARQLAYTGMLQTVQVRRNFDIFSSFLTISCALLSPAPPIHVAARALLTT